MKITIFDSKEYDKKTLKKVNKENHTLVFRTERLLIDSVYNAKGSDGVSTFVNCDVNATVIQKLFDLGVKYIFQRSAGYNNIDLKKAKELGIMVYRVPAYSPEAIAEFAITLLTSVNRNIAIAYNRTTQKNFSLNGLEGDVIFGKTIGVMGVGRIGQAFVKIANGFGAKVIVYDEFAKENFPETADKFNFKYVSKEVLFKTSDFISLHLQLLPSTKYIINENALAMMKKNVIIINTARGGLINTKDLLHSLDYGKIRGAGLDVYEYEDGIFFFDHSNNLIPDPLLNRLRAHRNVILTSHQAFFTNLSLKQIAETTMNNIELAKNNDVGKTRLMLQEDGKIING